MLQCHSECCTARMYGIYGVAVSLSSRSTCQMRNTVKSIQLHFPLIFTFTFTFSFVFTFIFLPLQYLLVWPCVCFTFSLSWLPLPLIQYTGKHTPCEFNQTLAIKFYREQVTFMQRGSCHSLSTSPPLNINITILSINLSILPANLISIKYFIYRN